MSCLQNQRASPWLTGRWYLPSTRASRLSSAGTRVSPSAFYSDAMASSGSVENCCSEVADRRAAFLTRAVVVVFAIVAALGLSEPALRSTIEYQYREMLIRLPHHIPTMTAGSGIIAELSIQERYLRRPSSAQLRRDTRRRWPPESRDTVVVSHVATWAGPRPNNRVTGRREMPGLGP